MTDEEKIKEILEELRPFLNMDGGDVEFIKYDEKEGVLYVKLTGACAKCMIQDDTLSNGLLGAVKEKVPNVKSIINVPL